VFSSESFSSSSLSSPLEILNGETHVRGYITVFFSGGFFDSHRGQVCVFSRYYITSFYRSLPSETPPLSFPWKRRPCSVLFCDPLFWFGCSQAKNRLLLADADARFRRCSSVPHFHRSFFVRNFFRVPFLPTTLLSDLNRPVTAMAPPKPFVTQWVGISHPTPLVAPPFFRFLEVLFSFVVVDYSLSWP